MNDIKNEQRVWNEQILNLVYVPSATPEKVDPVHEWLSIQRDRFSPVVLVLEGTKTVEHFITRFYIPYVLHEV